MCHSPAAPDLSFFTTPSCTCRRCDWSERENTYLLLARVALGLLVDTYKVPSRQYLTVRDALHEAIPVSGSGRGVWAGVPGGRFVGNEGEDPGLMAGRMVLITRWMVWGTSCT